ncbi:MAG: thiamine pyrophosphate TPP-binding protein [Actinomycetia bacterium]|nr:thiamine pyrophosphate TPP-binding protein [Actinomycetes bacterium]
MTTVRDAFFDFCRRSGMTTMFGNPGSTELNMLRDFPDDFRYILGLQETVAVAAAARPYRHRGCGAGRGADRGARP